MKSHSPRLDPSIHQAKYRFRAKLLVLQSSLFYDINNSVISDAFLTVARAIDTIVDVSRAKTFNLKVEAREVIVLWKSSQNARIHFGVLRDEKPCRGVS